MRKFQELFYILVGLRSAVRGPLTTRIKRKIGDSTHNNRTLTVNQLVRYFNKTNKESLAALLVETTGLLKNDILDSRNSRTDAIDVNELITTYRNVVMNKGHKRGTLGRVLSKVG